MRSIYKDFDNPPPELAEHGWQHPKVKEALYEIYNGKCAYSEEKLSFEDAGVDHYRPQYKYPQLINEWSNLILVSKVVNKAKGAKFEVQGKDAGHLFPTELKADSRKLLQEKSLLLHPEIDRPENHFRFSRDGLIQSISERGAFTIVTCDLNNEVLLRKRKENINRIIIKIKNLIETFEIKDDGKSLLILRSNNGSDYKKIKEEVYKILNELKESSNLSKEFSLLYLHMLLSFNYFFTDPDYPGNFNSLLIRIISEYMTPHEIRIKQTDNTEKSLQPFDKTYSKEIPYALLAHTVEHFQRIRKLDIENIPINTQWIFLTGENGHGKTSILQSIALSFCGTKELKNFGDIEDSFFYSMIYTNGEYTEKFVGMFSGVYIDSFAAYGVNRLLLGDSYTTDNVRKLDSIFTNEDSKVQNINKYLITLNTKNKKKYDAIVSILTNLIPGLSSIRIDSSITEDKVYYTEKDLDNNLFKEIEFYQLAAGLKSIIAMIGDMIIQLGDKLDVTADGRLELKGIVLIDEIDAHLHPKYQKHFVAKLTELFPKVQFIASTHSPIPLLGAPYNTVILNVSRESAKESIKVERLDDKIDFRTLTPEVLLTSPIFGFDEIIPNSIPDLKDLRTEDSYSEVVFNKILEKKLNNIDEATIKKMEKLFE